MPRLLVLLVLVLAAPVRPTDAQNASESAAFITRLGADTLAVEQFQRTPAGLEATVVLRSPRTTVTHYRLDLAEDGSFSRYEAITRPADALADQAPLRAVTVVPEGDSLRVDVTAEAGRTSRRIAGDAGMLPFIDMVHWPFDLMLARVRAAGADRVEQPLFTERGLVRFTVGGGAGTNVTLTHPFRGTMTVETDADGRILTLDAGATTRKLTVTRVDEVDLEALARRFAARDTAGQSFGPLSGRGETTARVGAATISVDYGQPARRGRTLFGELVPWGEVWRTGANRATHFETDRDLLVGDLRLPAGTYTLFSIPEPDGGVLIISRQTGQNGNAYDPAHDFARVPMTRAEQPDAAELFTIAIEETGAGGLLRLQWGTTAFTVSFTIAP